jgi:hypothetical protein
MKSSPDLIGYSQAYHLPLHDSADLLFGGDTSFPTFFYPSRLLAASTEASDSINELAIAAAAIDDLYLHTTLSTHTTGPRARLGGHFQRALSSGIPALVGIPFTSIIGEEEEEEEEEEEDLIFEGVESSTKPSRLQLLRCDLLLIFRVCRYRTTCRPTRNRDAQMDLIEGRHLLDSRECFKDKNPITNAT